MCHHGVGLLRPTLVYRLKYRRIKSGSAARFNPAESITVKGQKGSGIWTGSRCKGERSDIVEMVAHRFYKLEPGFVSAYCRTTRADAKVFGQEAQVPFAKGIVVEFLNVRKVVSCPVGKEVHPDHLHPVQT